MATADDPGRASTSPEPALALVLVAGGSGTRLGADVPKAFVTVGGRTLLEHAVSRLGPAAEHVVVVAPSTHLDQAHEIVVAADEGAGGGSLTVVPGGDTRAGSVSAGLAALPVGVDVVAVHDVARPFATAAVLRACLEAVRCGAEASAPAVPVTDTLKRVADDGRTVVGTEDRASLRGVQTPQVFPLQSLVRAHDRNADPAVTDDLALVEEAGGRVVLVPGSQWLMKVTHPLDLVLAEALLAQERRS